MNLHIWRPNRKCKRQWVRIFPYHFFSLKNKTKHFWISVSKQKKRKDKKWWKKVPSASAIEMVERRNRSLNTSLTDSVSSSSTSSLSISMSVAFSIFAFFFWGLGLYSEHARAFGFKKHRTVLFPSRPKAHFFGA